MSTQTSLMDWIQAELKVAIEHYENSEERTDDYFGWRSRVSSLQQATSVANGSEFAEGYYQALIDEADHMLGDLDPHEPEWTKWKARLEAFEQVLDVLKNGPPK